MSKGAGATGCQWAGGLITWLPSISDAWVILRRGKGSSTSGAQAPGMRRGRKGASSPAWRHTARSSRLRWARWRCSRSACCLGRQGEGVN